MQRGCFLTNFILLLLFEGYQSFGIKKNVEENGYLIDLLIDFSYGVSVQLLFHNGKRRRSINSSF